MDGIELKAGPLDLVYQDGFIRCIKLGDLEIIRMINHALRDQNWGTIPMKIREEKIEKGEDRFLLTYTGRYDHGPVQFEVKCRIEGSPDGSVAFDYQGIALGNFKRNRIGFTVLHPIRDYEGEKVTIVHPDGSSVERVFPKWISPHQPFLNIKEMHWTLGNGSVAGSLAFEGEVFETEDQRNWTDASYKTYCTPLGLPFPVDVRQGDRIIQKVTLTLTQHAPVPEGKTAARISMQDEPVELTKFGILLNELPAAVSEKSVIHELAPDYLRVEFDLDHDFSAALDMLRWAVKMETPVELCLFTDRENPIKQLRELKEYFSTVRKLLLFGNRSITTPVGLIDLEDEFRKVFPDADLYAGTDAFFTELNRSSLDISGLDGVTYSVNPQVHAFDDQSLVETLEAQNHTVSTARHKYPGKKVNVSPVTFRTRWNPNATEVNGKFRQPTGNSDARQFEFFGACWFLISFKYLSESRAAGATYFELTGENGWFKFKNAQVVKSPAYLLRQQIKDYTHIVPCSSSHPLVVDAVCLKKAGKVMLLLVNWTGRHQRVLLPAGYKSVKKAQRWEFSERDLQLVPVPKDAKEDSLDLWPRSLTVLEQ